MPPYAFHGYAIISDDDRIADASGVMPESLKSDADWIYFQAELDRADLVLLGRVSHETSPNPKGRRRLVVSRSARGLERRAEALWWNPDDRTLDAVLAEILPEGGRIGVPGGQGVFDLILDGPGFAGFHLTRAEGVMLPGGRKLFAACQSGRSPEDILRERGYMGDGGQELEPGVKMMVWRRGGCR